MIKSKSKRGRIQKVMSPEEFEKNFPNADIRSQWKNYCERGREVSKVKPVKLQKNFIEHPEIPDFWSEANARQLNRMVRSLENEAYVKSQEYPIPDCHHLENRKEIGENLYSWVDKNCAKRGLPKQKRREVLTKVVGVCLANKMYD